MIGIIDFSVNNVGSIVNAVKFLGVDYKVMSTPGELELCDLVVLPGVGSFDAGMEALDSLGFTEELRSVRVRGTKILGICLGMQLLFSSSDEGVREGLKFFPQRVKALESLGCNQIIPHVGFNDVVDPVGLGDINQSLNNKDFYFVHSYGVAASDVTAPSAIVNYGSAKIVAAIRDGNIFGTQFHPEKSGHEGVRLIKEIYEC